MTPDELHKVFAPLSEPDQGDFQWLVANKPFLAHYTTISVLESIMRHEEIWFSNPLFMNDLEEMRFGINVGKQTFLASPVLDQAAGSPKRAQIIRDAFVHYFGIFEEQHAIDVYVFCLSEHDISCGDGTLSMWRAYGGNGNGAAIILNTSFLNPFEGSPLAIGKVFYGSAKERVDRLTKRIELWGALLMKAKIPDEDLHAPAYYMFEWLKLAALSSKHDGFKEEKEWRVIYLPERDVQKRLTDSISYHLGPRGLEPKLKFKIKPLFAQETWTFDSIVSGILLGPTQSSPLAQASVKRMLVSMKKLQMADKVSASTIPLRPSN